MVFKADIPVRFSFCTLRTMWDTLLILLVTQFVAMMSPGPDMFLILKNSLGQSDQKAAVATILGIALGLSVHITVSTAGLAVLLVQSEQLYQILRYAGAAYLAYLGLKSLFNQFSEEFDSETRSSDKSWRKAFVEGLVTNLLNPKVTLYILSLFTQLIDPALPLWQKVILGTVLVAQAVFVWWLFVVAVQLPLIRLGIEKYSIWIDRLFGLILVGIAGSVFIFT